MVVAELLSNSSPWICLQPSTLNALKVELDIFLLKSFCQMHRWIFVEAGLKIERQGEIERCSTPLQSPPVSRLHPRFKDSRSTTQISWSFIRVRPKPSTIGSRQYPTFKYRIQSLCNPILQDPVLMQPFTIGSSSYATLYYRIQSLCNPLLQNPVLHGGLTGKLTKCVQYGINDLYLYRPGFYVPDTSGSSRTVHKFVQVVTYRTVAKQADGQKITYCTDICLPKQLTVSARITVQL